MRKPMGSEELVAPNPSSCSGLPFAETVKESKAPKMDTLCGDTKESIASLGDLPSSRDTKEAIASSGGLPTTRNTKEVIASSGNVPSPPDTQTHREPLSGDSFSSSNQLPPSTFDPACDAETSNFPCSMDVGAAAKSASTKEGVVVAFPANAPSPFSAAEIVDAVSVDPEGETALQDLPSEKMESHEGKDGGFDPASSREQAQLTADSQNEPARPHSREKGRESEFKAEDDVFDGTGRVSFLPSRADKGIDGEGSSDVAPPGR
jgi:hypothetical protein